MNTDETKLTVRNLRTALYFINNQGMTIEELRHKLFEIEDQDAILEMGFSMWADMESQKSPNLKA